MTDVQDFLALLADHEGEIVNVEVGVRADDLPRHSRPVATFHGYLGPVKMVDDEDRPGRGVTWVPVASGTGERTGFYVEAERTSEVVTNRVGGKVWFIDGHYVAVVFG